MYERLDWLWPVELMLRRIIFIGAQARAADLPDPGPLHPKRPHKPCPWPDLSFDAANPTTRRASFANLRPAQPPVPGQSPSGPRRSSNPVSGRMLNPLPLAYPLNAILRVCTDPWTRIARLAARMKRGLVPLLATRARPQPVRTPHASRPKPARRDPRPRHPQAPRQLPISRHNPDQTTPRGPFCGVRTFTWSGRESGGE